MSSYEKAAIIGYWRQGVDCWQIGLWMGISTVYAEQIVKEYLATKPQNLKDN